MAHIIEGNISTIKLHTIIEAIWSSIACFSIISNSVSKPQIIVD